MKSLRVLLLSAALSLSACPGFGDAEVGQLPANPTYDSHVREILDTHCVPCHVVPPLNGAPGYLRLDQYDDDINGVFGAFTMRVLVKDQAVTLVRMPPANRPDLATSATERAILDLWVVNGGPQN